MTTYKLTRDVSDTTNYTTQGVTDMFTTINGWTKDRIKQQILLRNDGTIATNTATGSCKYRTKSGNHCAVGCFIPDGHIAMSEVLSVGQVLHKYPELQSAMPLPPVAMGEMQAVHDNIVDTGCDGTMHDLLLAWVDNNVVGE